MKSPASFDPYSRRSFEPVLWFALPLLAAVLLHPGWIEGRGHPDENYHLKILAESISRGTLAFPVLHGKPWFTKPPLLLWLAAAFDAALGVGPRAAIRLVSLTGWSASFALAYSILRLSVPDVRRASIQAFSAVSLFGVLWFSRIGMMDLPLLANLLAACWWAHLWAEEDFAPSATFKLAAVLALGGWWKGPVFYPLIVLPMAAAIGRERISGALRAALRTWPLWIAVLGVGNGWILLNLDQYGWVYGRKFIVGENLKRLHGLKPLRLAVYFLIGVFPFWIPLARALSRGPSVWLQQKSARIGLALAVSTVAVFGYGADKHFHWFIPAYVGLALVPWPESSFKGRFAWPLAWTMVFSVGVYHLLPASIRTPEVEGLQCSRVEESGVERPMVAGEEWRTTYRGGLTPIGAELRALIREPGAATIRALSEKLTVRWRCVPRDVTPAPEN